MKPKFQRYTGFSGCVLALCAASCRPLLGLDEEAAPCPPVPTLDGKETFPTRWWVNADCDRASAPDATDAPKSDDGPDLAQPIYLALYDLRIGQDQTWREIGFDLDGYCSNDGQDGRSCANARSTGAVEGGGCRDNAIGQLLDFAKGVVPDLQESNINCELKLGGYNILLRVSEYNGLSDDPQVRIDVYASVGWTERVVTCKDGVPDYTGIRNKLPDYQPDWLIMPEAQASADSPCKLEPRYEGDLAGASVCATNAYVRGGYLVANVEQAEFWLNGQRANYPGFRVPLARATLVGWLRYVAEKQRWQLDATLGGATTVDGMLDGFATLGVCETTCKDDLPNEQLGGFTVTSRALADTQDLSMANDNAGGECDALSIGWQFAAAQTTGRFSPAPRYSDVTPKFWELNEDLCDEFSNPVAVCAATPTSGL